jgi:FlaG/FlaF family flagellin (archaellin)
MRFCTAGLAMWKSAKTGDRGVSTSMGVLLLLGVVALLAAVVFGGVATEVESHLHEQPSTDVDAKLVDRTADANGGDVVRIKHQGGDTLRSKNVYLVYENVDTAPGALSAGDGRVKLSRLGADKKFKAGDVHQLGGKQTNAEFGNATFTVVWGEDGRTMPITDDEVTRVSVSTPTSFTWDVADEDESSDGSDAADGDDGSGDAGDESMTPVPTMTPGSTPTDTPKPATPTPVPIDVGGGDSDSGNDEGSGDGGDGGGSGDGDSSDEDDECTGTVTPTEDANSGLGNNCDMNDPDNSGKGNENAGGENAGGDNGNNGNNGNGSGP